MSNEGHELTGVIMRDGSLRRLNRTLLITGGLSVFILLLSFVLDSMTAWPDLYVEGLSCLATILLAIGAIHVMRQIDYMPKITPAVIAGAIAITISQILNFSDEIPQLDGTFIGNEGILNTRFVRDTTLYVGAAVIMFGCYFSLFDAAVIRRKLAAESERRAHALRDREEAEEALRESESRYRQLVDLSPIAIFVHVGGKIVFANQATAKLIGAPSTGQLLGAPVLQFVCPEYRDETALRIQEVLDKQTPSDLHEIKVLRLDGELLDVEVTAIPITYHGQRGSQVVMHDLTDRRQAEAEKNKLELQIRHAQKMEAIGTLAGGIAHDFNNLLAGILGYSNMLKMSANPGETTYKAADVIERAADRASQLTQQLLGFARKGKLQIAPVDPRTTINDVVSLLSRTIDKNIKITQKLRAGEAKMLGDPGQIQQVLLNLGLNARDAMPEGGDLTFETDIVVIDAATSRRYSDLPPGDYVMISVTDSGCGMSREVQDRVFEPFFTTKEQGKGTGMGLAMVYGIVKNHGGGISLYSEEGSGTTFKVYLPLTRTPDAAPLPLESREPVRGHGRILVIDDEDVVREMATDMLVALGYTVMTAADGDEALALYREKMNEIDLAVIDMVMPRMGGRDCFRELKKLNPAIKAILSTGYSRDGAAQEILDEGMMGFAQKPYRMNQLSELVASVLN